MLIALDSLRADTREGAASYFALCYGEPRLGGHAFIYSLGFPSCQHEGGGGLLATSHFAR